MDWIATIGAVAAVITCTQFGPQARQTWLQRRDAEALAGVSAPTFGLAFLNGSLWMSYGIGLGNITIVIPNLVSVIVLGMTLSLVLKARVGSEDTKKPAEAQGFDGLWPARSGDVDSVVQPAS